MRRKLFARARRRDAQAVHEALSQLRELERKGILPDSPAKAISPFARRKPVRSEDSSD
jgi:hypothetical protein